jgi:integrase
MNEVETPKGLTKKVETFSAGEIKMLLTKAKDHRLSAFFVLACNTGARRGELLALRWSDFDSAKQTISISKLEVWQAVRYLKTHLNQNGVIE